MNVIEENLETKEVPFSPKLEGLFRTRFYDKVSTITDVKTTEEVTAQEVEWVENECSTNLEQRKIYRAAWFLLKDLVKAHWIPHFRDGRLMLTMPNLSELLSQSASTTVHSTETKSFLRSWMENSRLSRLQMSSSFIWDMENGGSNRSPISELIADGHELSERLKKAKHGELKLGDAISPYLQLVQENERDSFTNIKISDIWRYCRLSWSTPALTTPGRTMLYLIRDAAHPKHAVMGIASLENCAVQIADRDNYIGWTVPSLISKLESGEYAPIVLFKQLQSYIQDGIDSIKWDEICTKQEIQHPTPAVISRLKEEAEKAGDDRQDALLDTEENAEKSELGQISLSAEKALYRAKRCSQLAQYLAAKMEFDNFHPSTAQDYVFFCKDEKRSYAIKTAFTAQKSKHIGSSMLELNVCGAIPPYNEILAGKLVALAALSPQVTHDYKERYGNKPSDIATRLKGEDVCRCADLAFIGTTSLYFVGSSQYNRLKLPKEYFGSNYDAKWEEIGVTSGFGTIQISDNTSKSLTEVNRSTTGYSHINHIFGEGASPKMRLLSQSLSDVLETSSDETQKFMQHAMKRIVYGASLASNTREYLLGNADKLEYYIDFDNYKESTQRVIDYWIDRWLSSRINYAPVFDRLESFDKSQFLVSKYLVDETLYEWKELKDKTSSIDFDPDKNLDFIRGFYRGNSAFADCVDSKRLDSIHVKFPLEDDILKNIKLGKDVVLTGNAGDGKTHLIRVLSKKMKKVSAEVIVELDASTLSNAEIFEKWSDAKKQGVPFVIAINAAVLYNLYKYEQDGHELIAIEEAFTQLRNSVVYSSNETSAEHSVVVYDLSKRDILSQKTLQSVIEKMTEEKHYVKCQSCPLKGECDVHKNRRLLQSTLFQKRLLYILERVTLVGHHATLRELQSFISYLIFANRDCKQLMKTSGKDDYDMVQLIYGTENRKKGTGALFDNVSKVFDPCQISHPYWDERILLNNIPENSWDSSFSAAKDSIESSDVNFFYMRKRQFYFFNKFGEKITELMSDNLSQFKNLFSSDEKTQKKELIRKLNYFFTGVCENPGVLNVWTGHRYNNSGRRILVSATALKLKDFSIGIPRINDTMKHGIGYIPDHLLFRRANREDIFLKVDYEMYDLLQGTEKGIPVMFIDTNLIKKVWRFMDQLQSADDIVEDELEFTIVDIQQKKKLTIVVDTDAKQYTKITSSTLK